MTPGTKNGGYTQTPQTSNRQGLYRVRFSDYEKSIHEKRVQQLNNQIIQNIKKVRTKIENCPQNPNPNCYEPLKSLDILSNLYLV